MHNQKGPYPAWPTDVWTYYDFFVSFFEIICINRMFGAITVIQIDKSALLSSWFSLSKRCNSSELRVKNCTCPRPGRPSQILRTDREVHQQQNMHATNVVEMGPNILQQRSKLSFRSSLSRSCVVSFVVRTLRQPRVASVRVLSVAYQRQGANSACQAT